MIGLEETVVVNFEVALMRVVVEVNFEVAVLMVVVVEENPEVVVLMAMVEGDLWVDSPVVVEVKLKVD